MNDKSNNDAVAVERKARRGNITGGILGRCGGRNGN